MCEFKSVHTRQSGKDYFVELDIMLPYDYSMEEKLVMEKKLSAEEVLHQWYPDGKTMDINTFNENKVLRAMEEYASQFRGEAVSDAVELLTCPHCKSFDSIYIESEYGKEDELDDFAENVHYQIATCQKCGDSCSPIELFKNRNNE